ncbi:MAG: NUDIX hydrolase [Sphingomonadaceae bacterium]
MIGRWRSAFSTLRSGRRKQYGALPYRIIGQSYEILLVTSRSSGQWLVPKGWLGSGMTPPQSAAREALEEAGVIGEPGEQPLGVFSHVKSAVGLLVTVEVYPLRVTRELDKWDERSQRQRRWFSQPQAITAVSNPRLRALIRNWEPDRLADPELFTSGASSSRT